MDWNAEQPTQALSQSGVNVTTLKAKILADVSLRSIIRGGFHNRLQFDEKNATEVESLKKDAEAEVRYEYTLRPILFHIDIEALSMPRPRSRSCSTA
jgi:hypothetical protein